MRNCADCIEEASRGDYIRAGAQQATSKLTKVGIRTDTLVNRLQAGLLKSLTHKLI